MGRDKAILRQERFTAAAHFRFQCESFKNQFDGFFTISKRAQLRLVVMNISSLTKLATPLLKLCVQSLNCISTTMFMGLVPRLTFSYMDLIRIYGGHWSDCLFEIRNYNKLSTAFIASSFFCFTVQYFSSPEPKAHKVSL